MHLKYFLSLLLVFGFCCRAATHACSFYFFDFTETHQQAEKGLIKWSNRLSFEHKNQECQMFRKSDKSKESHHSKVSKHKEALLILPGFGSKYHLLHKIKKTFKSTPYDVFVPRYIDRGSMRETLKNFDKYWKKHGLNRYQKVHVFGYIVGSWTINSWIAQNGRANIATVVYDRSTLQERAPLVLVQDMKLVKFFLFGNVVKNLLETPYPLQLDTCIRHGMLLETYATNTIRKHKKTADSMGPYCWEVSCFEQKVDDYRYIPLNHDQMYTHPEIFAEAFLYFIENGNFGSHFQTVHPVDNPFIKYKL